MKKLIGAPQAPPVPCFARENNWHTEARALMPTSLALRPMALLDDGS